MRPPLTVLEVVADDLTCSPTLPQLIFRVLRFLCAACGTQTKAGALEHGALYKYQPFQTEQWFRISGFGMDECGWLRPRKQIRRKPPANTESSASDESVLLSDFHQTSCRSGGRQSATCLSVL